MDKRLESLRAIAARTLGGCRTMQDCAYFGETRALPVFVPAGDGKYPSFWVRDCAMSALCGLIPDDDLRMYVEYTALCGQNGPRERKLKHGLAVPPYAVADHINYNGRPVFYPGTYSDGDDQGTGDFGFLPPLDDNYWFVLMAEQYVRQSGDRAVLDNVYGGMTLAERLERAWEGYGVDESGLCMCEGERWAVDWGFCDSIRKSGLLLMPSLLRRQAALALCRLGIPGDWQARADAIAEAILANLRDAGSGWLFSASGLCRQHDVWATACAAAWGALDGDGGALSAARAALKAAYESRSAVADGYVRQLPLDEPVPYWESRGPADSYQNGGYWSTPTGWYYAALYPEYPDAADALMDEFIAHTARYSSAGAPYEWISADTSRFSGCVYATSAALPLEGYEAAHRHAQP